MKLWTDAPGNELDYAHTNQLCVVQENIKTEVLRVQTELARLYSLLASFSQTHFVTVMSSELIVNLTGLTKLLWRQKTHPCIVLYKAT